MSEFSRIYDLRALPADPQAIEATPDECTVIAARFDLVAIKRLSAAVTLVAQGPNVIANGRLHADVVQPCAVSGEDLAVQIDEPVALRFVPALGTPDPEAEIELDQGELDDIEMSGGKFDLGEALAQTLGLAIDPYLTGPQAEEARRKAGIIDEAASGPFAGLKGLMKD